MISLVDLEIIMMVVIKWDKQLPKIDGSKLLDIEYPGHSDDPNNQHSSI